MEVIKKDGLFYGLIKKNVGTKRRTIITADSIKDLIRIALHENSERTMPILNLTALAL